MTITLAGDTKATALGLWTIRNQNKGLVGKVFYRHQEGLISISVSFQHPQETLSQLLDSLIYSIVIFNIYVSFAHKSTDLYKRILQLAEVMNWSIYILGLAFSTCIISGRPDVVSNEEGPIGKN